MSTSISSHPRRIAAAVAAIAVTALLHGGWLANLNGPQRTPTVAVTA